VSTRHLPALITGCLLLTGQTCLAADVYVCSDANGQKKFQDHPCDGNAPALKAGPTPHSTAETQAARQECEDWSQIGYLAAAARDAKQPQQQLLERYGRDGLDDGERAAIEWAYREHTTPPHKIKEAIRRDCLSERLQESGPRLFAHQPEKKTNEFQLAGHKYLVHASSPWVVDNTQSGTSSAQFHLFANGSDSGKMQAYCRVESKIPTDPELRTRLLNANANADLTHADKLKVITEKYADGQLSYARLPVKKHKNPLSPGQVLREPNYLLNGLLIRGVMQCNITTETFLEDGPAQQGAIETMRFVLEKPAEH
jgi:hypothetical protein